MNKYILLVVSAVALAFTSCSDSEEIEIKYQVNFTISPATNNTKSIRKLSILNAFLFLP